MCCLFDSDCVRLFVELFHANFRKSQTGSRIVATSAPIYFADTGHFYAISEQTVDFDAALNSVANTFASVNLRAHLASVTSEAELTFLVNSLGARESWIGAADYFTEGEFIWVDGAELGSAVSQTGGLWDSTEPNDANSNEDCTQINGNGKVNDFDCTKLCFFVIE